MGNDRRRFESLYEAHASAVLAYALRRTDQATADDVVSEVFLVVWRRLDDVPREPRLWLLGTARKVLANHRRGQTRRDALQKQLIHQRPATTSSSPSAKAASDGAVLTALAALRDADREALLLVAWDGLTPAQAAEVVGVRARTFSMRLSRARTRLAAILEQEPPPPPATRTQDATAPLATTPGPTGRRAAEMHDG